MERIWIYQAERALSDAEQTLILERLKEFTGQWRAHGKKLSATAEIRHSLFIILMVDDAVEWPSGCSIDKSVYLLKDLEQELGIDLFDRLRIAYRRDRDAPIELASKSEFEQLFASGQVDQNTIVFNNLVPSYPDLSDKWEVPLSQSWHAKVFS
ncbi:MAG TPA: ABC transporter ATPase [Sphingobacteriaceae bacterium]|nr:ABC transporter ATPase [Sphingobacteriaceae bacterium]